MTSLFLNLIKIATGCTPVSELLVHAPSDEQWKEALVTANKQTMIGVLLPALEEINKVYPVPRNIWIQWNFFSQKIREKNRLVDSKVIELGEMLTRDGFRYCILKGQGVARYYPCPELRTSGDIDVWMVEAGDLGTMVPLSTRRTHVVDYVRGRFPHEEVVFHHVDFPVFGGKPDVEAHFTPSYLLNFAADRRLQKYFMEESQRQFSHSISLGEAGECPAPTVDFNRVFLLIHIYKHLFDEGIGLRQLMDYAFALKAEVPSDDEKARLNELLGKMKMTTFSKAVMYIMKEIFGVEDKYLYIEADEAEGRFILDEVMKAGNFGKFDERIEVKPGMAEKFIRKTRRNLRFINSYSAEVLSDIPFRVWQFCWRMKKGYFKK